MSNRRINQVVQEVFRQAHCLARSLTKGSVLWLMRTLMLLTRRPAAQGFVLPTVAMVSLVVIVLTGAMIFRSFERSRNATNVRVDQAILNAGAPAIDRARAKLAAMFEDPSLPRRGTPNDQLLQQVLSKEEYTFADEIRLKMVADFTNPGGASNTGNGTFGENARPYVLSGSTRIPNVNYQITNDESSINAWKFPVDTDSNGRFDAYTLYAINYRLPARNNTGEFLRPRSTLDARTPPMDAPAGAGRCASTSGAASVTGADWYSSSNRQSKAFFIYTVTGPIAAGDPILTNPTLNPGGARYEVFRRQAGFAALETQQDYSRIAVNNNAILFEDDLSLSSGPPLRISGRVFTNSNLFLRGASGTLDLFQVSSPASCFYKEENSKIIAGGNVKKGSPGTDNATGELGGDDPGVHLYRVPDDTPDANDVNTGVEFVNNDRSTNNSGSSVSYNSLAYNQRIALLVEAALDPAVHHPNNDPTVVTAAINNRLQEDPSLDRAKVRAEELEIYFRNRTRRVPNNEVNYLGNPLTNPAGGNYTKANVLQGTSPTDLGPREQLRPPTHWMFPFNYTNNTGTVADGYTGLTMRTQAPAATDPAVLRVAPRDKEQRVGDRLYVGNNMPALWYLCDDGTITCNNGRFVGNEIEQPVWVNATTRQQWTNGTPNRTRRTQVVKLDNLDTIARDGLWETQAALTPKDPTDASDNSGGLRIIVGAGIYERQTSFLPPPPDLANVGRPSVPDVLATNVASTAAGGEGNTFPYAIREDLLPVVWPDTMPMSPGLQVYNNDPTLGAGANRNINLADSGSGGANIQNLQALTTTDTSIAPRLGTATGTASPADAGYASVDPNSPKYSKGDLRMRAAVVYHHRRDAANPNAYTATPTAATLQDAYQVPIACVSSYYDPSTPQTARNRLGLPDVSGGIDRTGNRTSPAGVLPATTIGDGIVDQNLYGRQLNDLVLGGFP
ncbi:MAG: hormogonium polysaccharide biosynthesis protein HpsA, partial [Cyanobacteria bacterium]|nr:hormogonium polysaccharide biosynthesis protein HpsA [Cyanobacteriota bacterium]